MKRFTYLRRLRGWRLYLAHHHLEIAMVAISGSWIIFLLSKLYL